MALFTLFFYSQKPSDSNNSSPRPGLGLTGDLLGSGDGWWPCSVCLHPGGAHCHRRDRPHQQEKQTTHRSPALPAPFPHPQKTCCNSPKVTRAANCLEDTHGGARPRASALTWQPWEGENFLGVTAVTRAGAELSSPYYCHQLGNKIICF